MDRLQWKVGRQYLYDKIYGLKIDRETLVISKGGYGQIYPSKEAYEGQVTLLTAWRSFRDRINSAHYCLHSGLTVAKIEEAEKLLGL